MLDCNAHDTRRQPTKRVMPSTNASHTPTDTATIIAA
jgi:hypothetical protein